MHKTFAVVVGTLAVMASVACSDDGGKGDTTGGGSSGSSTSPDDRAGGGGTSGASGGGVGTEQGGGAGETAEGGGSGSASRCPVRDREWLPQPSVYVPFSTTLQAEDGALAALPGSVVSADDRPEDLQWFSNGVLDPLRSAHGTGYVIFDRYGSLTLTVEIPASQTYAVSIRSRVLAGKGKLVRSNNVTYGETTLSFASHPGRVWRDQTLPRQFLAQGSQTITISMDTDHMWGWIEVDEVTVTAVAAPEPPAVSPVPADPDATPEARRLLRFLSDEVGCRVVAGQHDVAWNDAIDMAEETHKVAGKYPAIMNYDMMHMKWAELSPGGSLSGMLQDDEAIAWQRRGGIVGFHWHWAPGTEWGFWTFCPKGDCSRQTQFRIDRDPTSAAYQTIIADLDRTARTLLKLQAAGVAVLWRPLHEGTGGGFWWGGTGPSDYVWLYRLMYDRFVHHHGLHNLLWVWNGEGDSTWYPGDDVVDLASHDYYGDLFLNPRTEIYDPVLAVTRGGAALVGASEVARFPDADKLARDGVWWSYVNHWYDDGTGPNFSGDVNLNRFYQHPYVLSLESLPDLSTYPY